MQSLDFTDQEMKIAVIKAIFKHGPTLKFLAGSLMEAIYHLHDTREDDVLMSTLISLYEENNASEQEIEDILQEFPRFLGAEISVPRIGSLSPQLYYTQKRLILYALMHKKISWIKVTLPKIKYIQLQWDEDDKPYLQDFFKTYLPTCKNLETLFLGNCLTNQEVLLLREELKFLRNLKDVRISFKEDDVSLVLSLIEVFPSSVKRFLTGLYSGDLETKDGIRRLESFKEIIGQVFDKNPSLFIQLDIPSPPRAYTPPEEYPKYSEVAKNRIREILGVAHVPEERIKLRFS